jgi:hypothetical protein
VIPTPESTLDTDSANKKIADLLLFTEGARALRIALTCAMALEAENELEGAAFWRRVAEIIPAASQDLRLSIASSAEQ